MSITIQAQSVIYHNEKKDLFKALDGISNAIRNSGKDRISSFVVKYGDASAHPVFSEKEINEIKDKYK